LKGIIKYISVVSLLAQRTSVIQLVIIELDEIPAFTPRLLKIATGAPLIY
jgi:hypothetical protein